MSLQLDLLHNVRNSLRLADVTLLVQIYPLSDQDLFHIPFYRTNLPSFRPRFILYSPLSHKSPLFSHEIYSIYPFITQICTLFARDLFHIAFYRTNLPSFQPRFIPYTLLSHKSPFFPHEIYSI